jgi:hypothetical protein
MLARPARPARLALASAGLAVVGLVGAASAAPKPIVTGPKTLVVADPAGDERGGMASTDIASVTLTTTGKTTSKKVKGKTVTTYTPTALVVSLNLSAAPSTLPATNFEVGADTSACGSLSLYRDGGDLASGGFVGCGSPADATGSTSTAVDAPAVVGNSVVWTMPFVTLPAEMKAGSSITGIHGYVSIAEPLSGVSTSFVTTAANVDDVASDAVYTVG